jgi:hypothetical protein
MWHCVGLFININILEKPSSRSYLPFNKEVADFYKMLEPLFVPTCQMTVASRKTVLNIHCYVNFNKQIQIANPTGIYMICHLCRWHIGGGEGEPVISEANVI